VKSAQAAQLEFFSAEQAAEVGAIAAQLILSDETPRAREAGCIRFPDRALTTLDRDKQAVDTQGLQELGAKAREASPGSPGRFSAVTSVQQPLETNNITLEADGRRWGFPAMLVTDRDHPDGLKTKVLPRAVAGASGRRRRDQEVARSPRPGPAVI
jgi:hypothetical protein